MFYPLGFDYIRYLNDEGSYGMTYDQWKNKKMEKDSDKCNRCGNSKDSLSRCRNCKY